MARSLGPDVLALDLDGPPGPALRLPEGDRAGLPATLAAGPPVALSMTKRALTAAGTSSLAQALEVEGLAQTVNVHTRDLREALAAYAERRPPVFEGR